MVIFRLSTHQFSIQVRKKRKTSLVCIFLLFLKFEFLNQNNFLLPIYQESFQNFILHRLKPIFSGSHIGLLNSHNFITRSVHPFLGSCQNMDPEAFAYAAFRFRDIAQNTTFDYVPEAFGH